MTQRWAVLYTGSTIIGASLEGSGSPGLPVIVSQRYGRVPLVVLYGRHGQGRATPRDFPESSRKSALL